MLSRLPDTRVIFTAGRPGPVTADTGMLSLVAEAAIAEVPHPDIVLVPGGPGQEQQMADRPVHQWLREADTASSWTTSVCTGSLILAAAGLLAGRKATSHWLALDALPAYGVEPVSRRVVLDGKYITAAGVSAGIDMALELAGRIAGGPAAQAIQLMIEYDPHKAPADMVARMRLRSRHTAEARCGASPGRGRQSRRRRPGRAVP